MYCSSDLCAPRDIFGDSLLIFEASEEGVQEEVGVGVDVAGEEGHVGAAEVDLLGGEVGGGGGVL